jgi:hypothetical protein
MISSEPTLIAEALASCAQHDDRAFVLRFQGNQVDDDYSDEEDSGTSVRDENWAFPRIDSKIFAR